jgi:hypothetical protein
MSDHDSTVDVTALRSGTYCAHSDPCPSEIDGAAGAEHTCLFRTRLDTGQQGNAQIKMQ